MQEFGERLRQARDFKGVSLRDAERATRISRNYLSALEAGDFDELPAPAYARGIVRNYAQYLGLDPAATLDLFEHASGQTTDSYDVIATTTSFQSRAHWVPNFAIIAFMLVISAILFAWMYSAYFRQPETATTTAAGVPTVTPMPQSILEVASQQATVPTQGGGFATTTPTPSPEPSATPTIAPQPTEPVIVEAATEPAEAVVEEPVDVAATDEVVEDTTTDEDTTAEPVGEGAHAFVIYTAEEIWVQVVLDGEVVQDGVLPAGAERVYYGDSVAITSGNSAFVQVYVDGEDFGTLGESWDATFSYP